MAHAEGGVAGFVHRHEQSNPPGDDATLPTSQNMDDLKMSTSAPRKRAGANTPAPRSTRSITGKQLKMENDIDCSGVDQVLMATRPRRSRSNGGPVSVKREDSPPQPDEYDQIIERPEYEVDGDEMHDHDDSSDMPHDPFSQLQQHNGDRRHVHERAPGPPSHSAFAQKQIKGDSYPPTTDGDRSVVDQPGLPPYFTQSPENNIRMKDSGGLPARGGGAGGSQVVSNPSHRPQIPGRQSHNPRIDPASRNAPMADGAPNSNVNNVVADANAAFRRPRATKPGGSRPPAPAPAQARQPVGPPQSRVAATQAATTHVAQRGSPPVTDMTSHPDGRQRYDPGFQRDRAPEPHEHQHPMKRAPVRPGTLQQPMLIAGAAGVQDTRELSVQRHEPTTSRTAEIDDFPPGTNRQQYRERERPYDDEELAEEQLEGQPNGETDDESDGEPDNLDYEEEAVYEMSYSFLKNEPFDIDPQAEDLQLPEFQQHQTLEAMLQAVSGLPTQFQHAFFTSLPVEQWEEAGDWFLEQFGEVLKKFKAARQDKRKAAREFEHEIEQRHEAVSKKRKLTEDALSEMKKTGSVVLQCTPRKPKKTRGT